MKRLLDALRSMAAAVGPIQAEQGRLQIPISDTTHALLAELAALSQQSNHVRVLGQALGLHTAVLSATADGSEILFRAADGALAPLRPGTGPSDEIHEDRRRLLRMVLTDRARAEMDRCAAASGCRDLCDLVIHALHSYRDAIAMTNARMVPVRRAPDGTITDHPLFRTA